MNALSEIGEILTAMKIPWQTGAYTEPAPDQYVVLVPWSDTFDSSKVWGPLHGRKFYIGLRFALDRKE